MLIFYLEMLKRFPNCARYVLAANCAEKNFISQIKMKIQHGDCLADFYSDLIYCVTMIIILRRIFKMKKVKNWSGSV